MKNQRLSHEELLRDTQRLLKNLSRRFDRIKKSRYIEDNIVAEETLEKYQDIVYTSAGELRTMEESELRRLHRDLYYVNQLKTSRIKGVREVQNTFSNVRDRLDEMFGGTKSRFWEAYSKSVSELHLLENFKYELFDVIADKAIQGESADKIFKDIIDNYKEAVKEGGQNATTDDIKLLFTNKLRDLL